MLKLPGHSQPTSARSILDHMATLPPQVTSELYEDMWTCQAIFRSLPAIAKQYVLRLLFCSTPQTLATLPSWVSNKAQHDQALHKLSSLRVCTIDDTSVSLNPLFQSQLQKALYQSEHSAPWVAVDAQDPEAPSVEALDAYSQHCWESVLHYMVGSGEHVPSENMAALLVHTDLMQMEGDNDLRISNRGFQFLLRDIYSQVWALLVAYINTAETRAYKMKEVLTFLFQLSFLTVGKDYPVVSLSKMQQQILRELAEFGLVMLPAGNKTTFYPTRLGVNLCSGEQFTLLHTQDMGCITVLYCFHECISMLDSADIIVETNYRVYAYTSSPLKIAILSLFLHMMYRVANLAVGIITRDSVRKALVNGISAEQILEFLTQNAHPQTLQRGGAAVPETVGDQLRLWQSERNRVTLTEGVLYDTFSNMDVFKNAEKYAKDLGAYVWSSPEKRLLFVLDSAHDQMRAFLKKYS